jgi:hypothetical protein
MAVSDITQDTTEVRTVSVRTSTRLRFLLYLAPFVVLPIVLVLAAIFIVPTEWFALHSRDPFLVTLGYGADLRNIDCQVLIYGDSTAMIGINPKMIQERTGLHTCNIAETEGMTMLNGTMVLDLFLKHNPRPRYLVFMYAPEGFDPESQRKNPTVTTFEAVTFRFRQPDKLGSFFALMKHPEDVFTWAEHGLRWAITGARSKPLPEETKQLRAQTQGQSELHDPTLQNCAYGRHNNPPDKAWVESLRSKYGSDGTTVLIDSVLLPSCDPDVEYFREQLGGVIDNRIDTLPPQDFYQGGRHVNSHGSVPLSTMVADQILDRLHDAPGAERSKVN